MDILRSKFLARFSFKAEFSYSDLTVGNGNRA